MTLAEAKMSWSAIASRGGLFSLIWWVLTDGVATSWWIGVPAVLLAVTASAALIPPAFFFWSEVLRFVPYFLIRSLLGGVDVAWRALHPAIPIDPDLVKYPMRLPPGLSRWSAASTFSLD